MPVTIKTGKVRYNDNGEYVEIDAVGGSGGTVVDPALSTLSENPVQNKVVTAALNALQAGKQNKLTFDGAPTAGSSNPVTSGGVAAAVGDIEDEVGELKSSTNALEALPIISPPDVQTLLDDGEYTDEAKIALQKALGVWEPPWELLNDITLTEEGRIDLTADDDGTPYNLRGAFIMVYYPANTLTASIGYGRFCVADEKGQVLASETGKYTSSANVSSKFCMVLRRGSFALMPFSGVTATGGKMSWSSKYFNGFAFDFGNITRIYMNVNDVEPAGTNIKIYAQRAY